MSENSSNRPSDPAPALRELASVSAGGRRMPVLFVGHGSPMNGIEDNEFSRKWSDLGRELPIPRAVLVVSAHWLTRGTLITEMQEPRTIHDFGGFPPELYQVEYPAPGSPEIAEQTRRMVSTTNIVPDHDWGLDHGAWTIVRHMYPDANIPVLQLSIDITRQGRYHYELADELRGLRDRGVLVLGSGNMVHNLRRVAWDRLDEPFGFDWALEASEIFKRKILSADHAALAEYQSLGPAAQLAVPTPDHFFPLLYALGMQDKSDEIEIFNDKAVAGALTMTSVLIG